MYKADDNRENVLMEVLLNMAQGNFYHRMELSGKRDLLDTLMFMINRICEEVHSYVGRESFAPVDDLTPFLYPVVFRLNDREQITYVNKYACTALARDQGSLVGKNFMEIMTVNSRENWFRHQTENYKKRKEDAIVRLELKVQAGILLCRNFFVHAPNKVADRPGHILVGTVLYFPRESFEKGIWNQRKTSKEGAKKRRSTINHWDIQIAQEVDDHMAKNLQNGIPDIRALAKKFGTNDHKLNDSFRKLFERSVLQQFIHKRLQAAKLLLLDSDMKIIQIAQSLGYRDSSYFTKIFKKETGQTPLEFRRKGPKKNNLDSTIR